MCQSILRRALAVLVLAMLALTSSADEVVVTVHSGPLAPGEGATVRLPGFNPSLGILRGITLRGEARFECWANLENTGPSSLWLIASGTVGMLIGDHNGIGPLWASSGNPGMLLGSFDGNIDFGGSSGVSSLNINGISNPYSQHYYGDDAYLRSFIGLGVDVQFLAGSVGFTGWGGDPGLLVYTVFGAYFSGSIQARYFYEPLPTRFCRSEGAGTSGCPCSSSYVSGTPNGCPNFVSPEGASLDFIGVATIGADSLVLTASGMPTTTSLLLQSSSFTYVSRPFGDGRLCLGGHVMRLASTPVSSGSAVFPRPQTPPLSVIGSIAVPGSRFYQIVYRDPMGFCTPSQTNATNGVAIVWGL